MVDKYHIIVENTTLSFQNVVYLKGNERQKKVSTFF